MKFNQLLTTIKTYDRNAYLYEGLNPEQIKSVKLWESAGIKLREAELTSAQIQQLFQTVEKGATDAGGNRTLLGKGKDAATAVNKAWEDLKTKIQNSGPIKNVDATYDSAVAKIEAGLGGPDNAINQVIQKYRKFAKEHPIAQSFIYAALIAAAGISGAGLGGAAVLGLLKMTDKLLQGEKFSSAAYQGAKTGALAYGASKLGDYIKGKPDASAPSGTGDSTAFDKEWADANQDWEATRDLANQQAAGAPAEVTRDYNADTYRVGQMGRLGGDGQGQIGNLGTNASGSAGGAADQVYQGADATAAADLDAETMAQNAAQAKAYGIDGADNLDQMNAAVMKTAEPGTVPADYSQLGAGDAAQGATDAGQGAADAATAASGHPGTPEEWAKGINPPPDWVKDNATGRYSPPTDAGSNAASGAASAAGSTPPPGAGMDPEYLQRVVDAKGQSGVRFKISPEDAKAALDWQAQNGGPLTQAATDAGKEAAKGYSKEYLEKVINGETTRPLISKEKAQELLDKMSGGSKPPAGEIGQALDPGIAPTGANGQPMKMVPMDEPAGAASDAAASAVSNSGPTAVFTNGNQGTVTLPSGETLPAYAFPEGGLQPRLPGGSEKMSFDIGGQKVDGYVYGGKVYFKGFDPASAAPKTNETRLRENQIVWLFARVEDSILTEGILDSIKGAAGKAMSWAQTKGHNLTTKVTADKLNSAWKSAGSPTDSEQVKAVIVKAGADPAIVDKALSDLGVASTPSTAETPPAETPPDTTTPPEETPKAPDELDTIKKNAGLPVSPPAKEKVTALVSKIGTLSPADKEKIVAFLKGK